MLIIEITLILGWGIFFTYWFTSAMRNTTPLKRTAGRTSLLTAMMVPIMLLSMAVGLYAPEVLTDRFLPDSLPLALAGIVLTLSGLAFAVWARKHLGTSWTGQPAIRENHKIVRTGPYSTVRNPIYSGTLLAIAGSTIATGYLAGVMIFVIAFSVFLVKIHMEERFLEDEFGEDYAGYKRDVRALVPFII
jgi:protein-S-isoprenylcysteine O-methyltransferase Ste14